MSQLAVVVLAGGRSTRMKGDKLALTIDGRSLLERAVLAAETVAEKVVVSGPRPKDWSTGGPGVRFVVEDPPFGGPVAGVAAALPHLGEADEVILLAGDLANPAAVVSLLTSARMVLDGVVLEDEQGWSQPLAGRYEVAALQGSLAHLSPIRNASMRSLVRPLRLHRIQAAEAVTRDLDTPADAALARAIMPS